MVLDWRGDDEGNSMRRDEDGLTFYTEKYHERKAL